MEVISSVLRLMGSAEGLGNGVTSLEDEICGANVSQPAFRNTIPDSGLEMRQPSIMCNDLLNSHGLGSKSSHSLTLGLEARFNVQKSSRLVKSKTELTKRPGMVNTELSKGKAGVLDVNGITPESASSPASYIFSEKSQLMKQKSTAVSRRADKRNIKAHKNKGDSFSPRNGLVVFSTISGGNFYLGLHRLKAGVFDITKHIDEVSLDELLCGSFKCPSSAIQGAKEAESSPDNLLESFRKACSVLEHKKVLRAQTCGDADNSFTENAQAGLVTSSSVSKQSHIDNKDTYVSDAPSSHKIKKSKDGIRKSNVADLTLFQPNEVLEHLILPPQKDLDALLSETGKTTPPKNCNAPRSGTPVSQQIGLPPFSWSHSSSGNSKLSVDGSKFSSNHTLCVGKWSKMKNSLALQKGTEDFLVDFGSLTFDQSLVPSLTVVYEGKNNESAPMELDLPASGVWSASKDPTDDEESPAYVAAQTLVDIYKDIHRSPFETIKLPKKPSHITPKASKSKPIERSIKFFDPPRSNKQTGPLGLGDNWFPSKKSKLSTNGKEGFIHLSEPERKAPLHWYGSSSSTYSMRSTVKLLEHSASGRDNYGANVVMKPFLMKPPRTSESRPSGQHNKLRKSTQ